MKICMDGIGISKLHGTEMYTYTYEVLNGLLDKFEQAEYSLLWDDTPFISEWQKNDKIRYANINIQRNLNDYRNIEEYLLKNKIDIYHSPNNGFSIPENKVCKYVSTIHTLYPLYDNKNTDKGYLNKFNCMIPRVIKNSDKIIVVSNFIKEQLQECYDVDDEKIEVIYPFCSSIFKQESKKVTKAVLKRKYNIDYEYILVAGSIHPRKNIDKILLVFKDTLKKKKDLKLVIVGKNNDKRYSYYSKLKELVRNLGIEDSVVFIGTVYYKDMPYFYSGAKCLVDISSYEGFPITVVEAINCKTPVICSKNSSFEEVLENEAVLVDNKDLKVVEEEILKAISLKDNKRITSDDKKICNWRSSPTEIIRLYTSIC